MQPPESALSTAVVSVKLLLSWLTSTNNTIRGCRNAL